MPNVWLPNEVAEQFEWERRDARITDFTKRLQAIDSRLELLLATKTYPDDDIEMGFFYVRRHNEDGTIAMWKVQNPDGTWREPDEQVIEAFKKADANTGGGWHSFRKERDEWHRQQQRNLERKREETFERLKDATDYAFRVQHPIRRKPWEE